MLIFEAPTDVGLLFGAEDLLLDLVPEFFTVLLEVSCCGRCRLPLLLLLLLLVDLALDDCDLATATGDEAPFLLFLLANLLPLLLADDLFAELALERELDLIEFDDNFELLFVGACCLFVWLEEELGAEEDFGRSILSMLLLFGFCCNCCRLPFCILLVLVDLERAVLPGDCRFEDLLLLPFPVVVC